MLADFHWLRPEWLWALPLIALMTYALVRRQLAPGSWQRIIDPALAPFILSRSQVKGLNYRWWLILIGGVLAVLALAGPSWNRVEQPVFRSEQAVVIALDLSRSMDAQDLAPSRLTRARLKILDILERRRSGQTALVVYSSNAFTVTPLTTDADTVAALVNSLSTDIMPSRGSYPVAAINKSGQLLEQAGASFGEVLLITDGGTSPAAERAAKDLRSAGYSLSVLGVGTAAGAPIPRVGGGFVADRSGNIVVPRLEEAALRSLAAAGGGRFATLSTDDRDIDILLSGEVGSTLASDESLATDQWQEEGPWLLLILVPIAAMAFRRGLVLLLLVFLLPVAEPVYAFGWQDLWLTRDQQAQRQLDQGNAMARLGELETAIDAYEQVLEVDPNMEDALYNRDLLKDLLEQSADSQGGEQGNQENASESGGGAQQSEGQSQSDLSARLGATGDPGAEGESSVRDQENVNQDDLDALQAELERAAQEAQQHSGEAQEQQGMSQVDAEAMRRAQEQRQAMEQWLRRIPNDPGGLLRRKFRYQYQRQGKDQDGNNLWPDDEVQPW